MCTMQMSSDGDRAWRSSVWLATYRESDRRGLRLCYVFICLTGPMLEPLRQLLVAHGNSAHLNSAHLLSGRSVTKGLGSGQYLLGSRSRDRLDMYAAEP